jgi:uncharacterized heparinase superfamily protein
MASSLPSGGMGNLIREVMLYYHTGRYLQPVQVWHRFRKLTKIKTHFFPIRFSAERVPRVAVSTDLIPISQVLARRALNVCKEVASQVVQNQFIFLNQPVEYKNGIRWNDPGRSRLWRFNLHYFDYGFALGATYRDTGERRYYDCFRSIVGDWISQNKVVAGDAWHPYTTSLRIVNWIYSYILFQDAVDNDPSFKDLFLKSLSYQASHLTRNLEFDLLGNHLIANAKALFFAGKFFENQRWMNQGISLLKDQAEEQILLDGGHFERSPMYHCIVLGDFLDCLSWSTLKPEDYLFLKEKVEQMLEFLAAILLPDGRIPLFNDSAYGIAPDVQQIFSYANTLIGYEKPELWRAFSTWEGKDSGYYVVSNKTSSMIIDGGKIGPDYQPGHGHCDLFSYELALGHEKIIVDSGVYEYEEGKMRNYCRSTKAHNTVMVDGKEQSEIWKSFRVARRAHPLDVQFVENNGSVFFRGRHDGYRRLGDQIVHLRWVAFIDRAFWLILDEVSGRGEHLAESLIHLHPEAVASPVESGLIEITKNAEYLTLLPFGGAKMQQRQHWYCPEFGGRYPNTVLTLTARAELPIRFGYLLVPGGAQQVEIAAGDRDLQSLMFDIHLEDKWYQVNLSTKTVRKVGEDGD